MLKLAAVTVSLAALMTFGAGPSEAQQGCPKRPVPASFSLWPENSMGAGQVVTGRHACGRQLRCEAGRRGRNAGTTTAGRSCRWL